MSSLSELTSSPIIKAILMGDSGVGKTGSLVSLVQAGYKLRILDFDSGLSVLALMIRKHCPELIHNVEYRTLDDKFIPGPGGVSIRPFAWIEACKMINNWKYTSVDGEVVDLGNPWKWGSDYILVIDSLSFLSQACFNWAEALNPNVKDRRQIYFEAQGAIEHMLAELKADSFNTNVVVIAHIKYIDREDGTTKGYPTSVGSALSPNIPKYFNSILQVLTKAGLTTGGKRTIQTRSTAHVDLKNPAAFDQELPLETGLAQFFAALKGVPWTPQTKLVTTTLQPSPSLNETQSSTPSTPSKSSAPATKASPMAIAATNPRPGLSIASKL